MTSAIRTCLMLVSLTLLGTLSSQNALALPCCDASTCACPTGYNGVISPCDSGCGDMSGEYCTMCNCIPGYSPGNSQSLANGANVDIIAFCQCKNVANSHASGKSIMIPTKTSTEWSSFYNGPPSGVTVTAGSCGI